MLTNGYAARRRGVSWQEEAATVLMTATFHLDYRSCVSVQAKCGSLALLPGVGGSGGTEQLLPGEAPPAFLLPCCGKSACVGCATVLLHIYRCLSQTCTAVLLS